MHNKSFRLTDQQLSLIDQLAHLENKKINPLIRELIDIGLREKGVLNHNHSRTQAVPKYEIMGTACSVETLILLRKFVEKSSPELIELARTIANQKLHEDDLMALIQQPS